MYPLPVRGGGDAELEALQTDVMRFVAILGLCLAAIFSLVQTAAYEQQQLAVLPVAAPVPEVVTPSPAPTATVQATPVATSTAVTPTQPRQAPEQAVAAPTTIVKPPLQTPAADPTEAPAQGYTLEFASAEALLQLLRTGQLQIVAKIHDRFWSSHGKPLFSLTEAPAHYYQMDAATVPATLLRALETVAGETRPEWGVVLPAALEQQLRELTDKPGGGALVIQADAEIRVEPALAQANSSR